MKECLSARILFPTRKFPLVNNKLHSYERVRWSGHVARTEEGRSAFKIVTGKSTGKRPSGRSRHRREDYYNGSLRNKYQYEELH